MKVVGVGWAKTGTTTLGGCFEILGFSCYGYKLSLIDQPEQAMAIASRFNSFQDWPWALLYKEMDQRFPGSKFVLTSRDSQRWLKSYRNALSKQSPLPARDEARRKVYGFAYQGATDEQLIGRYEQHNTEVKRYFADRPEDLLVVDWEKGDGWAQLCPFLGKPVLARPFPHANKGSYKR